MKLGSHTNSSHSYSSARSMASNSGMSSSAYAYMPLSQSASSGSTVLTQTLPNVSFEELRRQARSIETDLDSKLVQFSKLGAAYNQPSRAIRFATQQSTANRSASDAEAQYDKVSTEINDLLTKLARLNEAMQNYADQHGSNGTSSRSSFLHALQRHREILSDYRGEYEKSKANFSVMRSRAELLYGGSANSSNDSANERSGMERGTSYYLAEQEHLRNSDRLLDAHIAVAIGTKENLGAQRARLVGAQHRLAALVSQLPLVNSLLNRINFKKRKDCLILSLIISVCTIALLIYIFG